MKTFVLSAGLCLLPTLPTSMAAAQSATAGQTSALISVGLSAQMVAPAGWQTARDGDIVRYTAPEADFHVAVVPITKAASAVDAVAQAWRRADP